jgi:hypothetical protein
LARATVNELVVYWRAEIGFGWDRALPVRKFCHLGLHPKMLHIRLGKVGAAAEAGFDGDAKLAGAGFPGSGCAVSADSPPSAVGHFGLDAAAIERGFDSREVGRKGFHGVSLSFG